MLRKLTFDSGDMALALVLWLENLQNWSLNYDPNTPLTAASWPAFQVESEEAVVSHLVQSVSRAGICSGPVLVTKRALVLK